MSSSPFIDHASPILSAEPSLTDEDRSSLWDAFNSKNPDELTQHLQSQMGVPDDVKAKLLDAKHASMAPVKPTVGEGGEKGFSVLARLGEIDPRILDLAEAHPKTISALIGAASKADATKPQAGGETSAPAAADGKKTPSGSSEGPAADYPATPPGHALVQASDGGLHHIPHANLDAARKIDQNLKVLHVQP